MLGGPVLVAEAGSAFSFRKHHLIEDVDGTKVTLQVEHNKGGNMLSADSAFDKFGVLRGELGDSSKKQDASLSTTTADQLLLMMQRMQGGGATAAVDVPEPDAPADGAETREAGVPEDEDSSDDEPATVHVSLFNRLKTGGTMKPHRPAAAAKSSADTGGVHAKKPQSSADGAREAAAPSRRGDLTPQAPSARQAVVNLADDGRTRRVVWRKEGDGWPSSCIQCCHQLQAHFGSDMRIS